MTDIFESPDRGNTVYRRPFGSNYTERVLVETKRPYNNGVEKESSNEFESARNQSKTWSMEQD
jgi:hypothetical protein